MYTAERQRAQPYLSQIQGPIIEQWYFLHHRIVRVVTNRSELARQVRSYLYYAEFLTENTYEETTQLPIDIPIDLMWQAGEQLYKPVALTCYLFETQPDQPFPPLAELAKPADTEWEEISGVDGPQRARWKRGSLRFREYQAYPEVTCNVYSMLDKVDLCFTIFIEDVSKCAEWFLMRFVFYMVLGALFYYDGYEIVHAGAVALDGKGALLVGSPGSGKSTLVLSCLRAGFQHLADDVLFIAKDNDIVHMYAFPEDIGVRPGAMNVLGQYEFMHTLVEDERQKRFVDIQQHFGTQVVASSPISTLLFVHEQQRAEVFRAERITPVQAVSLLTQEYISRNRARESEIGDTFVLFSDLAMQVPSYRLWLTPNAEENAAQVRALLTEAP